ncbi:MAG TPA: ABC-2 family transporter protein [Rectinemataceae bacterium]|nr:ABC-2 family transporter protein [Rectinemataceae bacterium]
MVEQPTRGAGLRSGLRFLAASFSVNLQAVIEYRGNFLVQVFGMMLNNGAFALFWAALISKTGSIGGYGFRDIMLIWALVSSSFGLAHVIAGNVRSLGLIIQRGELDVYLLQPRDVLINVLCSRTIVSAWGDFAYGFLVLALLPGFSLGQLALFLMLLVSGAVIFASTFAAAESLSFFMGSSTGISNAIAEFLISFSLYPETVFDRGMRWVFYTLLPSGFIAFVPLAALKSLNWGLVPLLLGAALLYGAGAYALFRAGLRRYESGNQMGTRI